MANPADKNGNDLNAHSTEKHKAFRSRLTQLDDQLERAKARNAPPPDVKGRGNAIGFAFRLTVELVVGLVVGGFLGWWIDKLLGTTPAFLLIFFILGMSAGILNVLRTAKMMQAREEANGVKPGTDAQILEDDDDD